VNLFSRRKPPITVKTSTQKTSTLFKTNARSVFEPPVFHVPEQQPSGQNTADIMRQKG
jgi:hypothetical protein